MQQRLLSFLLSSCLFVLLLVGFLHPITAYTQDLGRHILLGKLIVATKSVPTTNLLSYTYPDFPFLNHHYLSEVIYYFLQQLLGDTGLLLFSVLLILASCGSTFFYSLKRATIIPASLLGIIYLRILFERTDIRPEQFGYLLFAVFLLILYYVRESTIKSVTAKQLPSKLLFLLIPLSFLWIQLHISFVFGLFLIGLFFLDGLYEGYKQHNFAKAKMLGFVLLASLFVTILNPNGIAGALYPLRIFQNYGYTIQENQTIFLLDEIAPTPSIIYFKIAVLFLFISLFVRIKHIRPIDWLLALSFTALGASAIRNFPFFALATFIPASVYFSQLYTLGVSSLPKNKLTSFLPILTTCVLLLMFFHQISFIAKQKPFGLGIAKGAERGVDFLETNQVKGPLFNNFDIGSYLAYRLYPREKVFIDGRPEAYPAEFIQQTYIPMQQDPVLFEKVAKQYNIRTIFFSHNDQTPWANQFLTSILQNPLWQTIYLDETSLILVRKTKENETLIKKFGMTRETLHATPLPDDDFQSLLKLASFFNKTGLIEQEIPYDEKLLRLQPTYCPALYSLAKYYTQKQNAFQSQIYQGQFITHCQNTHYSNFCCWSCERAIPKCS